MKHAFLTGKKVYLRALERGDLKTMFKWAHDPGITHYMYMGTFPNSIEGLECEYEALTKVKTANLLQLTAYPNNVVFAIIDIETDCHTGNIGLFDINWITRVAEVRMLIGEKEYWGHGRAQEAYRLVFGYAFDRFNLRRIVAGTRADNVASVIALKKVGFVQEGRQREHFLRNEQTYDILNFGLLRDEFYALFGE